MDSFIVAILFLVFFFGEALLKLFQKWKEQQAEAERKQQRSPQQESSQQRSSQQQSQPAQRTSQYELPRRRPTPEPRQPVRAAKADPLAFVPGLDATSQASTTKNQTKHERKLPDMTGGGSEVAVRTRVDVFSLVEDREKIKDVYLMMELLRPPVSLRNQGDRPE
jgi:hypothetical protein